MKTAIVTIFILIASWLAEAAVPAVNVRHYDEYSGLSHRSVKQIVQDRDGYIWLATWNGLNRFDGYEFRKIKPGPGDEARRFSDRIGDIKLMTDGNLLCRVDGRMLVFDTGTYKFSDLTSRLEDRLGRLPEISQVRQTTGGETVLQGKDGGCVVFADSAPVATARLVPVSPRLDYKGAVNHAAEYDARYSGDELVYSGRDKAGNVWLIARDGAIMCAGNGNQEPRLVDRIDTNGEKLYFCTIDRSGDIWLRSGQGAYCVSFRELPYSEVGDGPESRIRAMMRDRGGRIWLGDAGKKMLMVYDNEKLVGKTYVGADGGVSSMPSGFGFAPYAIAADKAGDIWVGTKPGGLHRLSPMAEGGYSVIDLTVATGNLPCDDVYDIDCDSRGRLWVATLGGGIVVIDHPESPRPAVRRLADEAGYPAGARAVRKVLVVSDTLVLAATRGGLLEVRAGNKPAFRLHASEPDRESSLSNIAAMDVAVDSRGRIFVATESGGVDMVQPYCRASDNGYIFRHFNEEAGMPSDVSVALAPDKSGERIWVVSDNMIYSFDPAGGGAQSYPALFRDRKLRFAEGSPLNLVGGVWLVGHDKGCLMIDFDRLDEETECGKVVFTSVSVQNGAPRLLSPTERGITLGAGERNLTLRFSALDYVNEADICYEFRIDGGEWVSLGHERSVSFLDLSPGDFTLEVRSTDSTGRWLDNAAALKVNVTPEFYETWWFMMTVMLLLLGAVAAVVWTVLYIRRINRKQRETLAAYLGLLDSTASGEEAESTKEPESPAVGNLSGEDAEFMAKVMEFVNTHISDSEVGVGDMAEYVAVSRSGLTRKLKTILGVTPSEFLKESRLSRAASLITSTEMPIKDIAADCGFADLNYFGKCFKHAYGASPTGYRRNSGMPEEKPEN